jgi:hypothetical protein
MTPDNPKIPKVTAEKVFEEAHDYPRWTATMKRALLGILRFKEETRDP